MEKSRILIGAMRFKDRPSAVATVRRAIDCGFNYVDSAPCYCYKDNEENSESWVGEAVNHFDYRDRVMVSAKCTVGNGGMLLGEEFQPQTGFGARSAEQMQQIFSQSLQRINVERFDYYHLWTTHTIEQLEEAFKPGGWYEGLTALRDKWDHLGITTHAESDTIIEFTKKGVFESVTLPLNVVNTTRLKGVEYCRDNGIAVLAMNPFAGGFLAAHERLKELALRYLLALPGVHPLIGFSSPEEVDYAAGILEDSEKNPGSAEEILEEVGNLVATDEPRCTACGYCAPCPEGINVGASLSHYNLLKYMGLNEAKWAFKGRQWDDTMRLDRCTACGTCESRCPNGLPVTDIIADAKELLYSDS